MRLCLLPSDFDGPAFYRLLFPGRELLNKGHEVVLPKFKAGRSNEGTRLIMHDLDPTVPEPDADIYVIQSPRQSNYTYYVNELQKRGKIVVGESDDYDFGIPTWHPAFWSLSSAQNPDYNRDWTRKVFERCDALQVSTPFLQEEYSKTINAVVRCIPNYLDWGMWKDVVPVYEQEFRRTRIGWMGSLLLREGDVKLLSFLPKWLERNPNVEFVAAGSPKVHDFLGIPKGQRVSTGTVAFREGDLADITSVMDIGLVPMTNHPFNEAKSCLKGMEYGACGIPCIASPSQQYRYWVDGSNGFLAESEDQWIKALDELVADSELRRSMGRAAREKAREHSIDRHVDEWEDFYLSLRGLNTDRARKVRDAARVQSIRRESDRQGKALGKSGRRPSRSGPEPERPNPFERVGVASPPR